MSPVKPVGGSQREAKWPYQEIPLSPENQHSISLAGQSLQMAVTWRAAFWCLDIMDSSGADLIKVFPLSPALTCWRSIAISGLAFRFMWLRRPANDNPTETDLGINSHLYW
jgi:hypothetical protein